MKVSGLRKNPFRLARRRDLTEPMELGGSGLHQFEDLLYLELRSQEEFFGLLGLYLEEREARELIGRLERGLERLAARREEREPKGGIEA